MIKDLEFEEQEGFEMTEVDQKSHIKDDGSNDIQSATTNNLSKAPSTQQP